MFSSEAECRRVSSTTDTRSHIITAYQSKEIRVASKDIKGIESTAMR